MEKNGENGGFTGVSPWREWAENGVRMSAILDHSHSILAPFSIPQNPSVYAILSILTPFYENGGENG
ncbi:MAG: hypothetical protein H0U59_07150 [Gemmatimonadaceae bacterium]|nr:hypothetical protein [Gemmatimonadaceae bacterium]